MNLNVDVTPVSTSRELTGPCRYQQGSTTRKQNQGGYQEDGDLGLLLGLRWEL